MKVKMLKRDPSDYIRETKADIHRVPRNFDPELHPFESNREYVRATNAAKLERVFAKPFLGALDGHGDGVTALKAHPKQLSRAASASADGEIRIWDLTRRHCVKIFQGHDSRSLIRGIAFNSSGEKLFSIADDKKILTWNVEDDLEDNDYISNPRVITQPIEIVTSKNMVTGISHHRNHNSFVTCGEGSVLLWDSGRSHPVKQFEWGVDSVHTVKFNQIETNILAACASDRSIILYDIRAKTPAIRKIIMDLKTNAIAWNPMEAFVFVTANEDYNCYAFDSRHLKRPLNVHMDHIGAVIDIDYSPTGKEFVSGSYDKTIRIFPVESGHSREVYHTKRMQRLTCVAWSKDNRYILSGSDEMNIRLWKAKAWEKLGLLKDRQKAALEYNEKLKEKYSAHPKIKKIVKKRHVPKHVLNAEREHKIIKESKKKKEANRRAHSKPGAVPYNAERDKHVLKELE